VARTKKAAATAEQPAEQPAEQHAPATGGGSASDADTAGAGAVVGDAAVLESLARGALGEITRPAHVGALRDITVADDVATVRFSTTQRAYPGWVWTVAIAVNPGMEPSVLETELIPAEGALVAPDWIPWADRLEEYLAQQAAEAALRGEELAAEGDESDDDELDDDLDDDHDDDLDDADVDDVDDDDDDHDEHSVAADDDVDGVDIDLHLDDHIDDHVAERHDD